ncbi:unnamed protein product [Rotaria sp. Silwood2]|nr:unnamed protein product [Rotaria sp. Silwood2]CAF2723724.1 unnamed protein product [Rotaria sp. Silwood2]CAF2950362.1 unnamed protein product [Rotaria sp. Silwood2]CAF3126880.1 unnamed protein product [Rotaria sp. Silwood2]CAF4075652.1 unnamed protein product [Rotaria sp. Silwood2]
MASMVSNIQKIIRHHVPLIRFKYGANQSGSVNHASTESKSDSSMAQAIGASSQSKAGQKSASLEFSQTPKKYRRHPLTQDEIDLIAIGGFT